MRTSALVFGLFMWAHVAEAALVCVDNGGDSGGTCAATCNSTCTFRQAASVANAGDTIYFQPAPTGLMTVTLASPIDINKLLFIDGYLNSGVRNTDPVISNATLRVVVVAATNQSALILSGNSTVLSGLVFQGQGTAPLVDITGQGVLLQGNFFGVQPDGITRVTPGAASSVRVASTAKDTYIGISSNNRCVFGGATLREIEDHGDTTRLQYCLVGLGRDGTTKIAVASEGGFISDGLTSYIARSVVSGYPTGVSMKGGSTLTLSSVGLDAFGVNGVTGNTGVVITGTNFFLNNSNIASQSAVGIDAQTLFGVIASNRIGTDAAAIQARPNGTGLRMTGNTLNVNDNVISGNTVGVDVYSDQSMFRRNFIGTNATGTAKIPNVTGVYLRTDANKNNIGTFGIPGDGNVISGNSLYGVRLEGDNNFFYSNSIGLNAAGTGGLGNGAGILMSSSLNTFTGNRIAGSAGDGIILTAGTGSNTYTSNYVGTDVTGTVAVPNNVGVRMSSANVLFGTTTASFNLVSGNTSQGFVCEASPSRIVGTRIGTQADGVSALGNGEGIRVANGAYGVVGGTASGQANIIAFNSGAGIIETSAGVMMSALSNSIHDNGGLGIDGATGLNAPLLSSAHLMGSTGVVFGSLGLPVGPTYLVQIFKSAACNPSGEGEGQTLLSSLTTVSGATSFTQVFAGGFSSGFSSGDAITATVTALTSTPMTSRFSQCTIARAPGIVSLSSAIYTTPEANDLVITLQRIGGSDGAVQVSLLATRGTATGADYGVPATVTFADGASTAQATIAITHDTLPESDEKFKITITSPTLNATLAAPTGATLTIIDDDCGNNRLDAGEACDDGNLANDDACTAWCQVAFCGDAIVQAGVETCDDANTLDNDGCTNACQYAVCGDNILRAGVEACDDGNNGDLTDACLDGCVSATCGDGFVHAGLEACDDGDGIDSNACTTACQLPMCGDGIVEFGVESCETTADCAPGAHCDACRCIAPPAPPPTPTGSTGVVLPPGTDAPPPSPTGMPMNPTPTGQEMTAPPSEDPAPTAPKHGCLNTPAQEATALLILVLFRRRFLRIGKLPVMN